MKTIVMAAVVAVGLVAAGSALAQEDKAKAAGCLTCHNVDATKKLGPGFKATADKYKGQKNAEANLVTKLSTAKGHPEVKPKGDDLKGLVKWVLSL
ncbi:MAG: cytochrome C [Betaproteobacteria bacterium]